MQYLAADIAAAGELRDRERVSLNLETRKREREQLLKAQLERENAWRSARGLTAVDSVEKLKPEEQPDPLLETAASMALEFSRIGAADRALLTQAQSGDSRAPAND
jgi:hypothetical protein